MEPTEEDWKCWLFQDGGVVTTIFPLRLGFWSLYMLPIQFSLMKVA